MAPPFVPSDDCVGVVLGNGTGGEDSTGTRDAPGSKLGRSHANRDTTHSSPGREVISAGHGPNGHAKYEEKLPLSLSASGSDLLRLMKNLPYHVCPAALSKNRTWTLY